MAVYDDEKTKDGLSSKGKGIKGILSGTKSDKPDDSSGLSSDQLKKQEGAPTSDNPGNNLFNSVESSVGIGSRTRNFFWGSSRRKQATIGAGVTGSVTGIFITILFIAASQAQIIQLSQILQRDFDGNNNNLSARFNDEISHLDGAPSSIAATRLGTLGQFYLRPIETRLGNSGITFNENNTGGLQSVDIDTELLAKADPDFGDLATADEQKAWLAESFGSKVSPDNFTTTDSGFTIDASAFDNAYEIPAAVSRGIIPGATNIASGPILGALDARVIMKMYDVPTLFHPLRSVTGAARKKLAPTETPLEAADDAQTADVDAAIDSPLNSTFNVSGLISSLKSNLNDFAESTAGKVTTGALLGQDAICEAYSSVGSIISFNRLAIAVPAALEATRLIALGDQIKSGQDISSQQVGQAVDSLSNSQGQTVWDAKALQVTENSSDPTGPDLPTEYNQAFASTTTAGNILNVLGANGFTGLLCSTPGKIISGVVGLALLIAAVPSDGASTATWLLFVAKVGVGAAGTYAALYGIKQLINTTLKDNAAVPEVLSGALGGNVAAYGAREAANIAAVTNGGVALNNTEQQQVSLQTEQQSQQQFASESFFDRIFDIDDYRSLLGKIADYIRPSITANIYNFSTDILNIGRIFSSSISGILPKASASTSPYNWGFPEFGTPSSLLDSPDPSLENPYQNAADVIPILQSDQDSVIERAATCFGVNINNSSGVWDVDPIANFDVNPQGNDSGTVPSNGTTNPSYSGGDCNDIDPASTNDWDRVVMFVLDTRAMETGTCYMGDAQSCDEIGFQ